MALNKSNLSVAILAILDNQITKTDPDIDPAQTRQDFADQLATAIDDYVKAAEVVIAPGNVQVQGTASAQTNASPVTGVLN